MTYANDPGLPFHGILLTPHDEFELVRLRASDTCLVTSNAVDFIQGDVAP
jgi:hypothetical protein